MRIIKDRNDFIETIKDGVTLVDFFATWCGPCKMLAPVLEEVSKEFEGRAKVVKVDVDEVSILASRYGVMSIPTLLFFKDGSLVHEQIGLLPPNQLLNLFKSHL